MKRYDIIALLLVIYLAVCHRTVAGCHRGEALPAGTCRAERTDKSR